MKIETLLLAIAIGILVIAFSGVFWRMYKIEAWMRRRSEHLHRLALRSVRPTETHSRIDPEDCADFQEFSEESEEGNRAFQEAYRQLTIEDILDQEGIVFRPQSSEVQAEPAQVFYNFEGVQRTGLIFEEFAEVEGRNLHAETANSIMGKFITGSH